MLDFVAMLTNLNCNLRKQFSEINTSIENIIDVGVGASPALQEMLEQVSTDTIAVEAGRAATEGYRDDAEQFKDIAGQEKNATIGLKNDVITLKADTNTIKTDTIAIRDQTIAARDASNLMKPTDIATFALMLAACQANQPRAFVVLNDEFQNDTYVPYTWTGRVLLEYGINKCDTQPTI